LRRYDASDSVANVDFLARTCMKILATTLLLLLGANAALADASAEVIPGNTTFALELYSGLKGQPGDLFFSPHSVSSALAMTRAGAAGKTLEQINAALHLPSGDAAHSGFAALEERVHEIQKKDTVRIVVANSIWPNRKSTFLSTFLETCKKFYRAEVTPQDFEGAAEAARITINTWVANKTSNLITGLLPQGSVTSLTRMILVNAIYFKGDWSSPFRKDATQATLFHLSSTETTPVQMMFQTEKLSYAATPDLQALRLPYAGNDLSMVLLLPREKAGIEKVEALLTPARLQEWLGSLKQTKVRVWLPKFKVESSFSLNKVLSQMGITDAFEPNQADFSRMNGARDLYISAVVHKAFVEVNEEGTEAAAATGVIMMTRSMAVEPPPEEFRADHPFLYLIRDDKTGTILFMGRCAKPAVGR
jgi:serpin B